MTAFQQEWNWKDLISYYQQRYHKTLRPVFRRVSCDIPSSCHCPACDVPVKNRKHFVVHKCVIPKCPYYLYNLGKVDKKHHQDEHGKSRYKLHYIYREFTIDFFRMDMSSLPKNASSLRFSKFDSNVMALCLTYRVNLGLSLRKTRQALKDIHNISISHQSIANYCKTAAICVKPFVDHFDYKTGTVFTADETYIKIRGVKGYIWFIMDAAKRSIEPIKPLTAQPMALITSTKPTTTLHSGLLTITFCDHISTKNFVS